MNETLDFTATEITSLKVSTSARSKIETKMARINRRLAKMGAPAATVTFGPIITITETAEADSGAGFSVPGVKFTREVFESVTVTGFEARHAGWRPIASLDHTLADDEALVGLFPSAIADEIAIPEEYRFTGPACDHCGIKIARNSTVLFFHEAEGWKQVGSSCVLEFWGVDPATVLWLLDPITEGGDDEDWSYGGGRWGIDPLSFLNIADALTARYGFTPTAGDWPTKEQALTFAYGKWTRSEKEYFAGLDIAAVADHTAAIVKWVEESDDWSDYMRSARLALRASEATHRTQGIIASLPHVFEKAMMSAAERAAKEAAAAERDAALPTPHHVGNVGEKITVEGEVIAAISIDTMYGTSRRVSLRTDDGGIVTTFGSGKTLWDVSRGDRASWTGKVAEHETTEKWGPQTVCKMVKLALLAEAEEAA